MTKWLQRVRGAIGIGLTWAVGWAPLGGITGWVTARFLNFPPADFTTIYALMFGVLGFVGGTIFSTVLSLTEGRRSFNQLSLPRFVVWGALGGLLLGGLAVTSGLLATGFTTLGAVIAGASALLGAGSAAGTLAIARTARSDYLLDTGDVKDAKRLANAE